MASDQFESVERALGGSFNRPRDWQAFERMARGLFAALHATAHVDLHGRSGQNQAGVDFHFVDAGGQRVGVQCKHHDGPQKAAEAKAELEAEIEKAKAFQPPLNRFVFLTTAANDAAIKRLARDLDAAMRAEGSFEVHHHAWDWIEAQLEEHPKIALKYGLTAYRTAETPSPGMAKIGRRFDQAIGLINAGRPYDEPLEHAAIAHFLGHADWRELERISAGTSSADLRELEILAEGLGLNPDWLLHGRDYPFRLDDGHKEAGAQFDALVDLAPRRIIFARCYDWPQDTIVAAQRDDLRWWVFTHSHPTREDVGTTGRHQIFDFCCLLRRLFRRFWLTDTRCQGAMICGEDYQRLIMGQVHPGTILATESNDPWWEDLAEMALDVPDTVDLPTQSLKAVIDLARYTLAQIQQSSEDSGRLDRLREAGLPLVKADALVRLDMDVSPPPALAQPKTSGWPRVMALELDKARFSFTAAHDHVLVDGACELLVANRAKIALKDCQVRLLSIEGPAGEIAIGAAFRVGSLGGSAPQTFDLAPGAGKPLLIARRNLKDIVGRQPWRLTLTTGDYDLPDGVAYRLRLELCSNYEFPTQVELVLDIDYGKAVSATIDRQRV